MSRRLRYAAAAGLAAAVWLAGCQSPEREMPRARFERPLAPSDQARAAPAGPTAADRQADLASFDLAWQLVGENHYDEDMNGLDWQAVRAELRPRVERADGVEDVRAAIREMVGRLGESHYAVLPREAFARDVGLDTEDLGDSGSGLGGEARPGFDVAVVGGKVVVEDVWSDAAAEAGVAAGDEVTRAGGVDVPEALGRLAAELDGVGSQKDFALRRAADDLLAGDAGGELAVALAPIDGVGEKSVTLPLVRPDVELVQIGDLPPVPLEVESRLIQTRAGPVGYFRFGAFLNPPRVIPALASAVAEAREAGAVGFVVDLRGNPGGFGMMAAGVAGFFVADRDQRLGTMRQRGTELNFVVNPRGRPFGGPLAILVDGGSMSTSEILAGGLRDLGRARLFGTRTAGAALPSVIEELPNGDRFQYAVADYVSANGQRLEGTGVEPDVVVAPDRRSLAEGRDPALEAALDWVGTEARERRGPDQRQAA